MKNDFFRFILKTQKIEYAQFDASFHLIQYSPNLPAFLSPEHSIALGAEIGEVFVELVGYEAELTEICRATRPPLELDWINQAPLAPQAALPNATRVVSYFNLHVHPYGGGLLVILRDISQQSQIDQGVYNRHNELDIQNKKIIEELKQANAELQAAYQTALQGWGRAGEAPRRAADDALSPPDGSGPS